MREFFYFLYKYPLTTFLLVMGLYCILEALGKAIHGPKKTIIIKPDKKDIEEYET